MQYHVNCENIHEMPNLIFRMSGVKFIIKPTNYVNVLKDSSGHSNCILGKLIENFLNTF